MINTALVVMSCVMQALALVSLIMGQPSQAAYFQAQALTCYVVAKL
jgi:hypothetical protein